MNNPFIKLKSSMKKTVFKDFSFTDERKNAVKETIRTKQSRLQMYSWKEETLSAVLETLQNESKNGYDISTQLIQKQVFSFQNNEGQLYILLHLLENKDILTSKWVKEQKQYTLTTKGKKYLAGDNLSYIPPRLSLKQLIEEVSL